MRRFILGVLVAFVAAGTAGAVELKEGDLILSEGNPGSNIRLFHFDVDTNTDTLISGFVTQAANCAEWVGDGPTNFQPNGILGVSSDGFAHLLVTDKANATRGQRVVLEVDIATGERRAVTGELPYTTRTTIQNGASTGMLLSPPNSIPNGSPLAFPCPNGSASW